LRDYSIDIYKGILVVLMIFAHVIQFMAEKNIKILSLISLYVNLTTFSGFLFAFGYVCEIAYFRKELCDVKPKMIKTIVKTLFSFYISGLFYNMMLVYKCGHGKFNTLKYL